MSWAEYNMLFGAPQNFSVISLRVPRDEKGWRSLGQNVQALPFGSDSLFYVSVSIGRRSVPLSTIRIKVDKYKL